MMKTYPTRRAALAGMAAASGIAVSGVAIANAAAQTPMKDQTIDLNWTVNHGIDRAGSLPQAGDTVELRRHDEPYLNDAIIAYSNDGKQLGFVPSQHIPALNDAMRRGQRITATVARKSETLLHGTYAKGWSVTALDLAIQSQPLAQPIA